MVNLNTQYGLNFYYRPSVSAAGPVGRVPPVDAVRAVSERSRPNIVALSHAPLPSIRPDPYSSGVAAQMRMRRPEEELADIFRFNKVSDSKTANEVYEEGQCRTCAERTYKDGSDDPGVSFKTATKISPEQAPYMVRGHEMEHVVRDQAKAAREDREVVRQSVVLHTDICPECGRPFISGGTTTTATQAKSSPPKPQVKSPESNIEI